MKKLLLSAVFGTIGLLSMAQTTLINPTGDGGFESGNSFALNNWTTAQTTGGTDSKWWCSTNTVFAGTRGAYISNNNTGGNNNYSVGTARVQHFYRDVTFPAGEPYITLTFKWKGVMESCCDYLAVYLVPTSTTPVAGTLLGSGQIGSNMNSQSTWQTATITLPCATAGTTQRLVFTFRCDGSLGTNPAAAVDNISLVSSSAAPTCSSLLGTGVTNIAALPYSITGQTTCGMIDDITSSNVVTCGATWYFTGEDVVYVFTPSTSGSITINLTSTGSYTGLMLYAGCPISTLCSGSGTCVAYSQSSTGNKTFCANVTAGTTYYLIIDSYASPTCNPYDLSISAPAPTAAGTICSNAPSITLPYTATGQTTACYGNDYTNASTGSCGSLYESGEDRVYALTIPSPMCIGITLSNASTSSIGYQVYSGCPGVVGTTCIANNGGSNPLSGSVTFAAAGTYYIIVDTWAAPDNATYDISIISLGTGPTNDLPCSASALSLNVNLSGDNSCSGSASEPAAPACWTSGTMNTVWYTVVCPASGQLKIRTNLGTLTNTQIALYSGTCGSLTLVACNDNAPACGSSSYNNSEITATGLTAGATYFIRVDGANALTGTFDIMAVDGAIGFPAAAGQDCGSPNPVCAATITVGNPGYQAYGNICDFNGSGTCLASGERGIAWYTIPISAAGNLAFDIVPNDYGNPNPITGQANPGYFGVYDETDYDFALWKITGAGATTCAAIASSGGSTPVRCNYSGLGVTGCFSNTTNNAPAAYNPGYNGAYEQQVPVVAGEVYLLAISNFSNSTSGFSLVFSATSPINYSGFGSSVSWTGGNNTNWNLAANWGGCSVPTCSIDADIIPASSNQPVLPAGNYYVRDLTISAGATLTLQAGAILHICGNYVNNGSLIASPTSTIIFDNASTNQSISGALVGADKFGNLTVTKTGGTVMLNNNIDIGGNFTTSNATSVFNTTGLYIRVAGNFSNFDGSNTFTNCGTTGTLEFNGTAAQTYNQGASTLTLNHVLMNHTGPGVTLNSNLVCGTSGVLTLTLGKIITNANEVRVTNTASAACTAGNASSFVQGNLRRYLNGAATSYNFPVGHATPGYELANITFTSATTIPALLARFDTWPTVPVGPAASECPTNTYNVLNALNHGYWTITASSNPTSGNYNVSLYNNGYTNSAGAAGWTVMKAATGAGPWALNGTCVTTSTAALTQRTGLNGFSAFATAQSVTPLPVELISFTGNSESDFNHLSWTTATEINNDYFTLERSTDGINFVPITRIDGAGNSTQLHDYSYNDMFPADGINYYRLMQTDFNGQSTYSNIVSLEFHLGHISVENVRPNPTSGAVDFDFSSPEETEVHYIITDVTGRVIVDKRVSVKAGRNTIATAIETEGAGVYSLKVIEEKHGFISVTRIVKY